MIDMNFLVRKGQVAGLEFINFQNDDFYVALSECYKTHISYETGSPVLQKTCEEDLKKIIKDYTGFNNITFDFEDAPNLYVDTGYFSPGHVLNNPGVEFWLDSTETSLYRWFSQNKSKIFKASIDYTTGKVHGAFCDIPVTLGINVKINNYFKPDEVKKWGIPVEGLMAGATAHEMGHVFSGCMMMMTTFTDNIVAQAGLEAYRKAKRSEDRVVVLKDAATLLGLPEPKKDELLAFAKQDNDESFLFYYTSMKTQRNNQRALSVGVQEMTAEVVADMYAIRMGCDKGLIAAIGVLTARGVIRTFAECMMASLLSAMLMGYAAAIPALIVGTPMVTFVAMVIGFGAGMILSYFSPAYSGGYNSDVRRMEDAVRQLIAKLKESKKIPSAVRSQLVDDISKLLKFINDSKKWWHDTGLYRAVGWLFAGGDFKLREIEHYTQALANNEMIVLSEKLKGIQA